MRCARLSAGLLGQSARTIVPKLFGRMSGLRLRNSRSLGVLAAWFCTCVKFIDMNAPTHTVTKNEPLSRGVHEHPRTLQTTAADTAALRNELDVTFGAGL